MKPLGTINSLLAIEPNIPFVSVLAFDSVLNSFKTFNCVIVSVLAFDSVLNSFKTFNCVIVSVLAFDSVLISGLMLMMLLMSSSDFVLDFISEKMAKSLFNSGTILCAFLVATSKSLSKSNIENNLLSVLPLGITP